MNPRATHQLKRTPRAPKVPWNRKPRKPLAPMSAKTKARQSDRRACCTAVRKRSGGRCEVRHSPYCTGRMDHTHEIKARSAGGSATDAANCLGVCFFCHDFIHHQNPNEARRRGWLV